MKSQRMWVGIGILAAVLAAWWLMPGGEKGIADTRPGERPPTAQATQPAKARTPQPRIPDTQLTVDPTFELAGLIKSYETTAMRAGAVTLAIAESETKWRDFRSKGGRLWGSEKWMKNPAYYRGLDTETLADECFERTVFANEMGIFDNPEFGMVRLKTMHNGFAEFFGRPDMWKGILHVYDTLSAQLKPDSDLITIVRVSMALYSLHRLYELPEIKGQIKGKEELFLQANLLAIKRFRSYIDQFDPQKVGTATPFFAEPVMTAEVALMLRKQVNPAGYARLEAKVKSIKWPAKQDLRDVSDFLDMVMEGIGEFPRK